MEPLTNLEGLTLTITVVWLLSLALCTKVHWSYTLNRRIRIYSCWSWLYGTMALILWVLATIGAR